MQITHYNLIGCVNEEKSIALVSDLHNTKIPELFYSLENFRPDFIAVNGDVLCAGAKGLSIYQENIQAIQHIRGAVNSFEFFQNAVKIAPVLFSTGNHELYFNQEDFNFLKSLGVILLDNQFVSFGDIVFGGLSSPYFALANTGIASNRDDHKRRWDLLYNTLNLEWIGEFTSVTGYKVLLSHHPEFYEKYLKEIDGINLILSGHTHGGQIRLFGRGLYAYGQGWFPRYTGGYYDNKMIVSKGLSNTSRWPRINNPTELIYVHVTPDLK